MNCQQNPTVFEFPIRVYYEDTDAGALVYHANYLKFYERARTELLSANGIEQDGLLQQKIAFVVKQLHVDNIMAAKFNDRLLICSQISELKKASMVFEQWIECHGRVINKARIQIACVNLSSMRPARIPSEIFEVIQRGC